MAAQQNFRSTLNGFNREDVVRYIEYLNSKHTAEVNQLKSELEFLRSKSEPQEAQTEENAETDSVIEQQAARIRELFDQNKAQEAEIAALQAEKEQLSAQLAEAQSRCSIQTNAELEAYRRAERMERLARERAEQVYHQANGVLADATVKVDEAADQIGALTELVSSQLTELQAAVSSSKQALKDAAATMYTLRPSADSE